MDLCDWKDSRNPSLSVHTIRKLHNQIFAAECQLGACILTLDYAIDVMPTFWSSQDLCIYLLS